MEGRIKRKDGFIPLGNGMEGRKGRPFIQCGRTLNGFRERRLKFYSSYIEQGLKGYWINKKRAEPVLDPARFDIDFVVGNNPDGSCYLPTSSPFLFMLLPLQVPNLLHGYQLYNRGKKKITGRYSYVQEGQLIIPPSLILRGCVVCQRRSRGEGRRNMR